jgi:DtxR family Mn-dependent transcriptional regulator
MQVELSSTLEDYLEAIFRIEKRKRVARVRDISKALGVAKSTVNAALKSLARKGMIDYEPYELVGLTEQGRRRAGDIVASHLIIRHFLEDVLALDAEKAEEIACEMEHAVDRVALERFVCFLAFIEKGGSGTSRWIDEFHDFISAGATGKSCRECMNEYMKAVRSEINGDEPG